jgi:alpha-glucosidase (family GH31 glycosyl hydrolase)
MKHKSRPRALPFLLLALLFAGGGKLVAAASAPGLPKLDGLFYETAKTHVSLPDELLSGAHTNGMAATRLADGRLVTVTVKPDGKNYNLTLSAQPDGDILKWGFAVAAAPDEYFTGVMERVVDGPQAYSWSKDISTAMNLRGQRVDMILKPTTSVYAPFYLSSRGYAAFAETDWPGEFDFCANDPDRVNIEFEGPSLKVKFYTGQTPAELVQAHALDAGPPFLPPKWMYSPWRWRDEHTQRTTYYDGTPVTGPFNSEFMEDVLLMKAYGISNGIYWIDRPWGTGLNGYDDFNIDPKRLPNFAASVKWLESQNVKMVLWIGPFFQGQMLTNALVLNYTLAGQERPANGNNYPMVDFTRPDAKKYWQDGVAKLLKLGVAGFKLDRAEEDIPEDRNHKTFNGRTIRENRDAYPALYVKAAYDVAKQYRGDDFFVMPRAAYTGSSAYGVFWGGDIGGTPEGLRASIIAVQRSAVMGYPNWGSDTCGYTQQSTDSEMCGRWLAFSCFTPIMEVGPTKNVAFWNFHTPPRYDLNLIAQWRLYARLHERLKDYSYAQAKVAHDTGLPIVRPLFLIEPAASAAWTNWWTYQYGPDILVSPVWKTGQTNQQVYLPSGEKWRDAWTGKVSDGGRTITVNAEPHQIPIFTRVGATVELGDLNQEWKESVVAAATRPDLQKLDAEVKAWFDKNK